MQQKNKSVLFDLDGTLLHSGLTFHKIVNQLKESEGEPLVDFEPVREFSSRGATLILKNCFPDRDENDIDRLKSKFLDIYHDVFTNDLVLYDGVKELIEFLGSNEIPWGIVTNKPEQFTLPIINKLGWDKMTTAVICPDYLKQAKPSPEGIYKALEILDGCPESSFYVGDHERDIQTGINAGLETIGCTYGYYEKPPQFWKADFLVDKIDDIIEIL
jgi:phosphoglycolate phosphatase